MYTAIVSIGCLIALFFANSATAAQITTEKLSANALSTSSFSIVFPENWQSKRITRGMVLASTQPEASPQASADIYYYVLPERASERVVEKFHARQKKHSVKNYIDKREQKASKWKSKVSKTTLENNVIVEQFDMEILQRSSAYKKRKTPVCRFFRLYHSHRAEVHVTYSQRDTCEAARDGFNRFVNALKWS